MVTAKSSDGNGSYVRWTWLGPVAVGAVFAIMTWAGTDRFQKIEASQSRQWEQIRSGAAEQVKTAERQKTTNVLAQQNCSDIKQIRKDLTSMNMSQSDMKHDIADVKKDVGKIEVSIGKIVDGIEELKGK